MKNRHIPALLAVVATLAITSVSHAAAVAVDLVDATDGVAGWKLGLVAAAPLTIAAAMVPGGIKAGARWVASTFKSLMK